MKQVTFAAGLLFLGLALGLVMPGVLAQEPQPQVQKWEQFCELPKQHGSDQKGVKKVSESAAAHGKEGYQLVAVSPLEPTNALVVCYRRPAR